MAASASTPRATSRAVAARGRRARAAAADGPTYAGKRETLMALNRAAMDYWHTQLLHTPAVLDYLRGRGWPEAEAVAKRYRLGYAPGPMDRALGFVRHIVAAGWPGLDRAALEEALLAAGLAKRGLPRGETPGTLRDVFYGRLIFPVPENGELDQLAHETTRIVAFGGRTVPGALPPARDPDRGEPPKYLNTPETVLYQKRKLFYGWPWAKGAIRTTREAIVLEGFLDYIRVREAGIQNILACNGTSLTTEHMKLLAKVAGKETETRKKARLSVVMMTDADAAGRRAAERGARVVLAAGFRARIATFGGGKDPDDLLRDAGADGAALFRGIVAQAQTPVMNYLDVLGEVHPRGAPWAESLRDLVAVLRNLQRRAAGYGEDEETAADAGVVELVKQDAERVAARFKLHGGFSLEVAHVVDLLTDAPAGLDHGDHAVGTVA
jgi:DNA primase